MPYKNLSLRALLALAEEASQDQIQALSDKDYFELEARLKEYLTEDSASFNPHQRKKLEEFLARVEFDWDSEGGGRCDRIRLEAELAKTTNQV